MFHLGTYVGALRLLAVEGDQHASEFAERLGRYENRAGRNESDQMGQASDILTICAEMGERSGLIPSIGAALEREMRQRFAPDWTSPTESLGDLQSRLEREAHIWMDRPASRVRVVAALLGQGVDRCRATGRPLLTLLEAAPAISDEPFVIELIMSWISYWVTWYDPSVPGAVPESEMTRTILDVLRTVPTDHRILDVEEGVWSRALRRMLRARGSYPVNALILELGARVERLLDSHWGGAAPEMHSTLASLVLLLVDADLCARRLADACHQMRSLVARRSYEQVGRATETFEGELTVAIELLAVPEQSIHSAFPAPTPSLLKALIREGRHRTAAYVVLAHEATSDPWTGVQLNDRVACLRLGVSAAVAGWHGMLADGLRGPVDRLVEEIRGATFEDVEALTILAQLARDIRGAR